jgi:transcriptional regulator with XRE-family HTH domain
MKGQVGGMSHHEDYAARVRAERKKRKWTQQELADRAGMSLRALQNFEGRKATPQPENLRAVLAAVDLDPEGADVAAETRAEWPADVQAFLDMMGAYLVYAVPEESRRVVIHDLTRQIFQGPAAPKN